jgi:hypothetical protein
MLITCFSIVCKAYYTLTQRSNTMSEVQTPGNEVPTPAVAVANPVAAVVAPAEVPNVSAVAVVASAPPVGVAPAAGAETVPQEVATILKSELAHVFDAFEHFSLMEGVSRLYALAKKHL